MSKISFLRNKLGVFLLAATCSFVCLAEVQAAGYYVSTTGNDSWSGTLPDPNGGRTDGPFLTLSRAQTAMRNSSTKTTYIRAGTYYPAALNTSAGSCEWGVSTSIYLDHAADNGETWSYYAADGYNTAIIDGGATPIAQSGNGDRMLGNGTGCAFTNDNTANVTVNGLQFRNYTLSAFWSYAGSNVTFTNNIVHDLTVAAFGGDAVGLNCTPGSVIKNNYIYNTAYVGIGIGASNGSCGSGGGMSNTVISGNFLSNTCTWAANPGGNDQDGGDCGAIYLEDTDSNSTNIQVTNNYTRDVNASSNGGGDFPNATFGGVTAGIYLDEGTSNLTATGNILSGIQGECIAIHGGSNDNFKNNVCDMSHSQHQAILFYQQVGGNPYPMTGNVFQNNIVVSGSGAGMGYYGQSPGSPMTIRNNAYFNYVGTSINTTGIDNAGSDANPTYVNPGLSCGTPKIAAGNPVLSAPVSFPGITGNWGPPGFVIPQTGTAPSWPATCSGGTTPPLQATLTVNAATPGSVSAQVGQSVAVTTHWAGGPTSTSQTIFMHIVDALGNIVFQDTDHTPSTLTTQWSTTYSESRTVTVPASLPVGTYRILAGLFDPNTSTRMTLTPGTGVTDNGDLRYQIGTVTVALAAKPAITSAASASAQVGTAFTYQITATNTPISYAATGLPAGLSINSGTGAITGTPTVAGTFNVTISASNTSGTTSGSIVVTVAAAAAGGTGTYLSDLTWTSMTNGWGPAEKNMSNGESGAGDGRTMSIRGATYAKGLGVHAASDIQYSVNNCTAFISDIGIDDEAASQGGGSVDFKVLGDGVQLYDSGIVTGASAVKSINVNITGKKVLELVVSDGGDGNGLDHSDWAGARIQCSAATGVGINAATLSSPSIGVGQSITYTTHWTGSATSISQKVFVHVLDANNPGAPLLQDDHFPSTLTTQWNGTFSEARTLTLPSTLPAGTYAIYIGLYDPTSGSRMTLTPGTGVIDNGDQRYKIATFTVTPPVAGAPTLNVATLSSASTAAGKSFTYTTHWVSAPLSSAQQLFVHVLNATTPGNVLFQDDHSPSTATNLWNGTFSETRTLTIPATLPAGSYAIYIGIYDPVSGNRTAITPGTGVVETFGDRRYKIATFTVTAAVQNTVVINAWGTPVGSIYPTMQLMDAGTGSVLQSWNVTSAASNYTYTTQNPITANLRVAFVNDAYSGTQDRNLFVNSLSLNGKSIPATDPSVYSVGCTNGFLQSTAMGCNGYFEFPVYSAVNLQSHDRPVFINSAPTVAPAVYPNPWKASLGVPNMTFSPLPADSTIKIFTVSGRLVKTWRDSGSSTWDLTNDAGNRVSSGIYIYLITDPTGGKTHGKFVVIQ